MLTLEKDWTVREPEALVNGATLRGLASTSLLEEAKTLNPDCGTAFDRAPGVTGVRDRQRGRPVLPGSRVLMPKSRKNPRRKSTKCTHCGGTKHLDYARLRPCPYCKTTGVVPEPPRPKR